MSLNSSHTKEGNLILYRGEQLLLKCKNIDLKADYPKPHFSKKMNGCIFLTTHRIIFINKNPSSACGSICANFNNAKNIKIEQPIFGANKILANLNSECFNNNVAEFPITLWFNNGGAIDFATTWKRVVQQMSNRYNTRIYITQMLNTNTCYMAYSQANFTNTTAYPYMPYDQFPVGNTDNVLITNLPPPYPGLNNSAVDTTQTAFTPTSKDPTLPPAYIP
ncbi:hypothetical protein A3Q56_00366 [Intoshia linei]|uniref:GRAM domain-containing protein n=1 Tax=Intoshia linei TaxID=1819745 RepID=A0A177BC10_9BILA|nr:hypothetical protein A3Q56_00366 [Intoshia linei]